MNLQVCGDRVILSFTEDKSEKQVGGIIIPTNVEDKTKERIETVLSVGKDINDVKVGDKVLLINGMGILQEHEKIFYIILREQDIIAIVDED